MDHSLLKIQMIAQSPDDFLKSTSQVVAVFDERSQDSGNISYGVLAGARRFFVKTAGMPENSMEDGCCIDFPKTMIRYYEAFFGGAYLKTIRRSLSTSHDETTPHY